MVDWRTIKISYLKWRIRRLEAQVRKLEEEREKLKGGGDIAY